MNIYTHLGECREAYIRLLAAGESLRTERLPPAAFAVGVLEAYDLLQAMALEAYRDRNRLARAIEMDRDQLFADLVSGYGHEIYYGDGEIPLVRALVEICAAQFESWSYEDCARAIASEYDAERRGDTL